MWFNEDKVDLTDITIGNEALLKHKKMVKSSQRTSAFGWSCGMRHLQKYKDVTQDKLIAGSQVSFWLSSLDTRHHTDFLLGFGSSPQESQGFAACCRLFAIHTIAKEAAVKL